MLQTLETPLHYTARSGNEDILMEIVHLLGPAKTLLAVNKQAKVQSADISISCVVYISVDLSRRCFVNFVCMLHHYTSPVLCSSAVV